MNERLWWVAPLALMLGCPSQSGSDNEERRLAPSAPAPSAAAIEAVVNAANAEGRPFAAMRALGPGALPELRAMLADEARQANRSRVAAAIGAIGGRRATEILIEYIDGMKGRDLDEVSFRSGLDAVTALGYTAHGGDAVALDYLIATARRVRRPAPEEPEAPDPRLDDHVIGRTALRALGLSGQPQAMTALEALRSDAAVAGSIRAAAAAAIEIWTAVNARGLSDFLRRR